MPLQIVRQDITKMQVDAIVNTTNERMVGYDGVDLAVHTAAGPQLDEECAKLSPLGTGQAKLSGAYNLPCKYVIHTVGPVWAGGLHGEHVLLRSCYTESLNLAVESGCQSVAFPLISSGAYGYPKDQVLRFAVQTISEFLFEHELTVYLCVFDRESYAFSKELFSDILAFIQGEPIEEYAAAPRKARPPRPTQRLMSVCKDTAPMATEEEFFPNSAKGKSLREYVSQMDQSFQEMLFHLIDESGMSDVECYKRANIDKRTFSKIKSKRDYKPSKQTAIAFAISLQLDLKTTQELLATAGFTLSNSKVFDKIIRYFIQNGNYNIFDINEALFEFDQPLLGV